MLGTPILFLVFNRTDKTKRVLEQLKEVKPKLLFVVADGPRKDNHSDQEKCLEVRNLILNFINWECELKTLFREENLGCGVSVKDAIDWFFSQVDEGIILEDDCIPNESFFSFCSTLLSYYRSNGNIMHITGTNYLDSVKYGDGSYYISTYPHIWGWATWRRAWEKYDFHLANADYSKIILKTFKNPFERQFWFSRLKMIKNKELNVWGYQWMFTIWREGGLCLNSNSNLVTNIGFDSDSTHTIGTSPYKDDLRKEIKTIKHPTSMKVNANAQQHFAKNVHGIRKSGYLEFYYQRFKNLLHKIKTKKWKN